MKEKPAFAAVFILVLIFFVPTTTRAQNRAPSNSNATQNAPEADAGPQQATLQNSNGSSPANPAGDAARSTAQPAAKKIWTNDDMGSLHRAPISTFSASNTRAAKAKSTASAQGASKGAQYRQQILNLQAKLPPLDEQISQLQAGLNGATLNSTRRYGGVTIDDWHDQLARLQKQRDDIAAKISSLQDEARHNDVPDNQIP
jgi:hypothetical protein